MSRVPYLKQLEEARNLLKNEGKPIFGTRKPVDPNADSFPFGYRLPTIEQSDDRGWFYIPSNDDWDSIVHTLPDTYRNAPAYGPFTTRDDAICCRAVVHDIMQRSLSGKELTTREYKVVD